MNKKELKHQVKDLYEELIECIDHSPSLVECILKIAKSSKYIKSKLNNRRHMREIKRRKKKKESCGAKRRGSYCIRLFRYSTVTPFSFISSHG